MAVNEKMIDKIKALLAKAESSTHEEEANAFIAGAQKLMMKHAIDEAMLKASGKKSTEEIITRTVNIRKWVKSEQGMFLSGLARIFSCRVYYTNYGDRNRVMYHIVGFESDAVFTEIMFESLRAQASAAALRADMAGRVRVPCDECEGTGQLFGAYGDPDVPMKCETCNGKGTRGKSKGSLAKSFWSGYYGRVNARCADRYKKTVEAAGETMAIVLRDKSKTVDAWISANMTLGRGKRSTRRNFDTGAYIAGEKSGNTADISGGRNTIKTDNRKALS